MVEYCFQETNEPTMVITSQYESNSVPLISFHKKLSSIILFKSNLLMVSKSLLYQNYTKCERSPVSSVIINHFKY